MKIISAATLLLFTFCLMICAQKAESGCPEISLAVPDKPLALDQSINLFAKVDGANEKFNLRYEWTFSNGKILDGQGTSTVKFLTDEQDQATYIEILLKITGLPKKCENVFSSLMPVAPMAIGEPVDRFGKIKLYVLKERLDNFLIALQNDPNSKGLLVINFNKRDSRIYKIARLQNCLKFFQFKKIALNKIIFSVSEGDYEEDTSVWIVPPGAKLPGELNSQIIEAAELKQKIKKLFLNK